MQASTWIQPSAAANFTAITALRGRNGSKLKSFMPELLYAEPLLHSQNGALCNISGSLMLLKQSCHSNTQRVKAGIFLTGAYRYASNNNTICYRATIESLGHGSHPCRWQTVLIEDCTAINLVQSILGVFRVENLFIQVF